MEWRWFCCCYLLVITSRREGSLLRTLAVPGSGRVLRDVVREKDGDRDGDGMTPFMA